MLRKIKCLNVNKNNLKQLGKSNSKNKNINKDDSISPQVQKRSLSRGRLSSLSQQRNCKKIIKMIDSPQSLKFKDQMMSSIQNLKNQYSQYTKNKDPLRYLKKSLYTKGIKHSKIDLTCIGGIQTDRNTSIKKQLNQSFTEAKLCASKFSFNEENSQNQSKGLNKTNSVFLQNSKSSIKNQRKIKGIKVLLCRKKVDQKIDKNQNLGINKTNKRILR